MGRPTKEVSEALGLVKDKMPINLNEVTILVPKHEIDRLVTEYVTSKFSENNGGR